MNNNNENLITPQGLAAALKMASEGVKNNPNLMKSTAGYMKLLNTYVERIITAKDRGKFVVTHGTQQPLEIYEAMDVVGLFNEFYGVISDVVKLESVPAALSISLSTGTPNEVCSFFRNMDGLMHAGLWPETDFMIYATSSCDNVKAFHTLGRRYNIPDFGMERPYYPFTPGSMEHWRQEHLRLITFLEEKTGKKLDYDRLKETVTLSYRLTEVALEIEDLVAHTPSPMSGECFGGVLLALRLMCGTQEAVDFLEELKAELQERIAFGIAAANPERFRVIWSSFTPFFDPTLMGMMQKKYGAVSVTEVLQRWRGKADWMIDENDPIGSLAYRTQLAPGNCQYSPSIDWAQQVVEQAKKFKADGAIFNNNWGCKQAAGLGPLVRDELMRKVGVPTLTLNVDVIDSTFTSRSEIEAQMDSFFEMIESSKKYEVRRAAA
jgi:benzoyl-CoA reductase/2-hydroxyglutaryl-CoA dehydratase subunit BcrC/BadD/HgdB